MTVVFALLGAKALYLLWAWLASAIVASLLSGRKGYGEKVGLATGLLLSVVGVVVWLVWPPRKDSPWKTEGILPRRKARVIGESARTEPASGDSTPSSPGSAS